MSVAGLATIVYSFFL